MVFRAPRMSWKRRGMTPLPTRPGILSKSIFTASLRFPSECGRRFLGARRGRVTRDRPSQDRRISTEAVYDKSKKRWVLKRGTLERRPAAPPDSGDVSSLDRDSGERLCGFGTTRPILLEACETTAAH